MKATHPAPQPAQGMDDDFDALLNASSLGAPHVTTARRTLPEELRQALRQTTRDRPLLSTGGAPVAPSPLTAPSTYKPIGLMLVDLGGGTTDVALASPALPAASFPERHFAVTAVDFGTHASSFTLFADLSEHAEALNEHSINIAVFGEAKSGKSTFLASLLGETSADFTGRLPTAGGDAAAPEGPVWALSREPFRYPDGPRHPFTAAAILAGPQKWDAGAAFASAGILHQAHAWALEPAWQLPVFTIAPSIRPLVHADSCWSSFAVATDRLSRTGREDSTIRLTTATTDPTPTALLSNCSYWRHILRMSGLWTPTSGCWLPGLSADSLGITTRLKVTDTPSRLRCVSLLARFRLAGAQPVAWDTGAPRLRMMVVGAERSRMKDGTPSEPWGWPLPSSRICLIESTPIPDWLGPATPPSAELQGGPYTPRQTRPVSFDHASHHNGTEPIGEVSSDWSAMLYRGDNGAAAVHLQLTYQLDDPYAVHTVFHEPGRREVVWYLARELLSTALHQRTGTGDVEAWSQHAGLPPERRHTFLKLKPRHGAALLAMPREKLRTFLAHTQPTAEKGK
ncbi:SsgA family sporulation/cell division regulator [Streptomyces sp. NBC_00140]|uniref:SsgA family sporulation/cell division regulator n=1 Tax=Streptomyces sp. NBC_00140 TaxID=2975664 RepID=UPI00224E69E5|nr:SsgA family sporulation/cell division regulator [Streptomyces sp. NBC_00140]MCX5327931.1 SsgA family sporulation/cell division regulator [Streptomyces sp. NBC_00140]